MAKFNLNFLQNILRIFIPLNTNMYMYSRIKDYHLKMRNLLIISVYQKLLTIP